MKSVAAVAAGCAGGQLAVVEPGQRLLGLVEAPEVDVGRAVLRPDGVHLVHVGRVRVQRERRKPLKVVLDGKKSPSNL